MVIVDNFRAHSGTNTLALPIIGLNLAVLSYDQQGALLPHTPF